MSPFFLLPSILITIISVFYAFKIKKQRNHLKRKYSPIIDLEKHIQKENEKLENQRNSVANEIQSKKDDFEIEKGKLKNQITELENQIDKNKSDEENTLKELRSIESKLRLASEDAVLLDFGYYEPNYNFDFDGGWTNELDGIKAEQKEMIKKIKDFPMRSSGKNVAGYITEKLTFNNSDAQGRRVQLQLIKLMLRAFNGECDAFISKVNWKNVELQSKRIKASFEAINKIGSSSYYCQISHIYRNLKLEELQCVFEYEEWKQEQKEEQRRIREQMREEEKAQREIEKAKEEAFKEEQRYQKALEKAQSEVKDANEKQKEKLNKEIEELMLRIKEMEEKKRTLSQAELTKTGHVYIISNIGSFGENIFKIGMTRRLEPMDRVKELGDASVPFPFDVHGMIRTSNAPKLETALHKVFDIKRLNLENNRKEFFNVTINEIEESLEELKESLDLQAEFKLTMLAEAKQYRQSEAKRQMLENSFRK